MILIDLLLLVGFLAIAKVLGEKALIVGRVDTGTIDIPGYFALGIGLAIISYAVFFLGLSLGLRGVYFKGVALILLVLWHKELIRTVCEAAASLGGLVRERERSTFATLLWILLLVSVIFNIFYNYAPPTGEDELIYHLNSPQKYLLHGKIFDTPEDPISYLFLTLNLLYIPLMAIKSVLTAKLLSAAFGILDMALVYLLTRTFLEKRYALLAAVLFYTTPLTIGLSGIGKIDAGVTFYALLVLWSFLKYSRAALKAENTWFVVFAVCSGILVASKWSGSLFVAAVTIMLVTVLIAKNKGISGTVRTVAVYGLTIMLFILPWLIKNMLWAGNPLYPARISSRLPYDEALYCLMQIKDNKAIIEIIKYYFFNIITGTGYVIAAFLPLYFILKKKDSTINSLLIFSGLFISILCISGYALDLSRYTYCCYAVFAIASAYTIVTLSDTDSQLKRFITALALVMILFPNVCMSVYFGAKRIPYIMGIQSADQYLQKEYEYEGWDVVKWVGENIPPTARICHLGEVWAKRYYYNQSIITGNRPSILRYSLSEAKAYFKSNNIGYIILQKNQYTEVKGVLYNTLPFLNVYWFEGTSIDREFVLLYSNNKTCVYKIVAG
ncbi:MAG: phospholipid carrier-dependent glycosyltransferase [Elusimicrobia bacterium]|nr:phospholipid carrier-dependent glycosyltransferase [Elusimicrobiota bacterium]